MVEGNGLAYDGTGFAMEVISGVRGVDDRLGRIRVLVGFVVIYMLALAVALFAFTGDWRTPEGVAMGTGLPVHRHRRRVRRARYMAWR